MLTLLTPWESPHGAPKWLHLHTSAEPSRRPSLCTTGAGGRRAQRSEGNKSNACTCLCGCTSVYVCACLWSRRVVTLINSPISSHSELLPSLSSLGRWLLLAAQCGKATVPDNIIYIVCRERLEHGGLIYATLGDLPALLSPGPIHQMAVFQCCFIGTCPWEGVLSSRECVYLCVCDSVTGLRVFTWKSMRVLICGTCLHGVDVGKNLSRAFREMDSIFQETKLEL